MSPGAPICSLEIWLMRLYYAEHISEGPGGLWMNQHGAIAVPASSLRRNSESRRVNGSTLVPTSCEISSCHGQADAHRRADLAIGRGVQQDLANRSEDRNATKPMVRTAAIGNRNSRAPDVGGPRIAGGWVVRSGSEAYLAPHEVQLTWAAWFQPSTHRALPVTTSCRLKSSPARDAHNQRFAVARSGGELGAP